MYSFIFSLCALILGYLFYGKFVEKIFAPDPSRTTPAITKEDGVDFIPMPAWKVYMIQFLNIAGTGPIFGAIMGAKFGPAAYLWIVFGCIFAGAVHDYMSGMMSIRGQGANLPWLIGHYLGGGIKKVMLVFTIVLLILVGAVFVYSPALILGEIAGVAGSGTSASIMFWIAIIIIYYIIATLLPIDKIIGKIYPVFAIALIFMAIGLMFGLFVKWPSIPEFWDGLQNRGPEVGMNGQSIFPCLFITIACGAISGFHATQSPMMARCIKSEKIGRPIFYGSMITEGIVALVWAAVASYFFFDGGAAEVGSDLSAAAPTIVTKVSKAWLGIAGGILAILGVVAAPITTGDTAFRSARLTVANMFKYDQKPLKNRLVISIPIFVIAGLIVWFNVADENGFNTIWRYFGWANQTLSVFTLWAIAVYMARRKARGSYLIAEIPAMFMTVICTTYILTQKIGFNMPMWLGLSLSIVLALALDGLFHYKELRKKPETPQE